MSRRAASRTVLLLVLFLLVVTIVMFFYKGLLFTAKPIGNREYFKEITTAVTSENQGIVGFCINYPPSLSFNKTLSIQTRIPFEMLIFGYDNDLNQSLIFSINNTKMFNLSAYNATVRLISFTPKIVDKGNYSILITVNDTSVCSNNGDSGVLYLEIHGNNTSPSFSGPIPNYTWVLGSNPTNLFDLDNYFSDKDNDLITYTYELNQKVSVFIDSLNRVSFTSSYYGTDVVRFVANDSEFGNYSNIINLTILLPTAQESGSSSGVSGGGGSGGGSGGGIVPPTLAEVKPSRTVTNINLLPEFQYYAMIKNDWLSFSYTKLNCKKEKYTLELTQINENGMIYTLFPYDEEYQINDDKSVLIDLDKDSLNDIEVKSERFSNTQIITSIRLLGVEHCSSKTCTDGIRNQGEERIDCGGPCNPCPTCTDGIRNQDEEGIDCGGSCNSCGEKFSPVTIIKSDAMLTNLLLGLIIAILLLIPLLVMNFMYMRKVFSTIANKVISSLPNKEISEKKSFVEHIYERLNKLEAGISEKNESFAVDDLFSLFNMFVSEYFGLKLEFTLNDVEKKISEKKPDKDLVRFIHSTHKHLQGSLEDNNISLTEFRTLIEEIKTFIFLLTEIPPVKSGKNNVIGNKNADWIHSKIILSLSKLREHDIEKAKQLYVEALNQYKKMPIREKKKTHEYLIRLYHLINFAHNLKIHYLINFAHKK